MNENYTKPLSQYEIGKILTKAIISNDIEEVKKVTDLILQSEFVFNIYLQLCFVKSETIFDFMMKFMAEHSAKFDLNNPTIGLVIANYCGRGDLKLLEVWRANGKILPCHPSAFTVACCSGNLPIMNFFWNMSIEDNEPLIYEENAIDTITWYSYCCRHDHPEALQWIFDHHRSEPNRIKFIYSEKSLDSMTTKCFTKSIKWWFDSGLELKYSREAFNFKTEPIDVDVDKCLEVMDLWQKAINNGRVDIEKLRAPLSEIIAKNTDVRIVEKWIEIFGINDLSVRDVKTMEVASANDNAQVMEYLAKINLENNWFQAFASLTAVDDATSLGHTKSLEVWLKLIREKQIPIFYSEKGLDNCTNTIVLIIWKYSRVPLKYTSKSLNNASALYKLNVLQLWVEYDLELKFDDGALNSIINEIKCLTNNCDHPKFTDKEIDDNSKKYSWVTQRLAQNEEQNDVLYNNEEKKLYSPKIDKLSDMIQVLYKCISCPKSVIVDSGLFAKLDSTCFTTYLDILRFWKSYREHFGPNIREVLGGFETANLDLAKQEVLDVYCIEPCKCKTISFTDHMFKHLNQVSTI